VNAKAETLGCCDANQDSYISKITHKQSKLGHIDRQGHIDLVLGL